MISMVVPLHFQSFKVKSFRGINSLELPNFGRVTLLTGKNSTGKTTILEAMRIYASRGDIRTLSELLKSREEVFAAEDDSDTFYLPDYTSLFHNLEDSDEVYDPPTIEIVSQQASHKVSLNLVEAESESERQNLHDTDQAPNKLRVSVGQQTRSFSLSPENLSWISSYRGRRRHPFYYQTKQHSRNSDDWPDPIELDSIGPGLPGASETAQIWDDLALTSDEDFVIEVLGLIAGDQIDRIAAIGDSSMRPPFEQRRFVVKFKSSARPFPLKRLGDGAQRLFNIALHLAKSRNGILLIDEVENGIHHSIQPALWGMVFEAARKGSIQIVATTHSWDCVASFAIVAKENPEVGTLFRLEKNQEGEMSAVHYSEEDLIVVAEQRIEVR